jgi:hypothetical protein
VTCDVRKNVTRDEETEVKPTWSCRLHMVCVGMCTGQHVHKLARAPVQTCTRFDFLVQGVSAQRSACKFSWPKHAVNMQISMQLNVQSSVLLNMQAADRAVAHICSVGVLHCHWTMGKQLSWH